MTKKKRETSDRNHFVGSVGHAFEILEAFGDACRPLSHSEIVQETRHPKASVHRMVSTLVKMGVLTRDEDGKYRLTFKLWGLGMAAFANVDVVRIAQPTIESLKLATTETAHLAALDGATCVTYLWKSESPHSVRIQFWVGMRTHSWRSATGRSMLAFLPQQTDELLSNAEFLNDSFDQELLLETLQKVKRSGFAVTKGENHPERGGIAAPIRDHTGEVVASCGIAVPRYRMTGQLIRRCVPEVLTAAEKISSELGYKQST